MKDDEEKKVYLTMPVSPVDARVDPPISRSAYSDLAIWRSGAIIARSPSTGQFCYVCCKTTMRKSDCVSSSLLFHFCSSAFCRPSPCIAPTYKIDTLAGTGPMRRIRQSGSPLIDDPGRPWLTTALTIRFRIERLQSKAGQTPNPHTNQS